MSETPPDNSPVAPRSLFGSAAAIAGVAAIVGTIASIAALEAGLNPGLVALVFLSCLGCLVVAGLMKVELNRRKAFEIRAVASVAAETAHKASQQLDQQEAELYARDQEFQVLYDYSPDILSRISLDGVWLYVSPGVEQATGLPPEHFVGKHLEHAGMPEEIVAQWYATLDVVEETKKPANYTFSFETPNGVRHYESRVAPVLDRSGCPGSYLINTRDITERQDAEAKVAHWRNVLGMALEVAHAGAWEYDVKTQTSTWSAELCKLLGLPDADPQAHYHRWLDMIHPDDRERMKAAFVGALESGDHIDAEYRMVLPDGRERVYYDVGRILRDREDNAERIVGFQIDVTDRVRSSEALKHEATFRKSIIERATEGICVFTPVEQESEIRFTVWNPQMEKITGYTIDEINRLGWFQTVYSNENAIERGARRIERMRNGEDLDAEESTITRKDSEKRVLLISTKAVTLPGGVHAFLAVMRDVTEERRATRALVESEERYRKIVETCLEGIWKIDREGATEFVNPQMAAILGYTVDEMLGHRLLDFMHAEDRAVAEERIRSRAGGGSEDHEFRLRHKDGRDVWARMATTSMVGDSGQFGGALAIVTDITRLREAELEAEQSRALLTAAFEASPTGIIVARAPQGALIMANSAASRMLGGNPEELTNLEIEHYSDRWQFLRADGARYEPEDLPLSKAMLHGETSRDVEVVIRDGDGNLHWALVNAAPVRDSDSNVVAGVVVFSDITLRIEAEREIRKLNTDLERRVFERTAELDAANTELEGFSYSVSHDLRAPLRGIDGWSLALLEDFGEDLEEKAREYLDRIRTETQRMGHLIDDLLRLAKVSRGKLHSEAIDLSALAQRVASRGDEHDDRPNKIEWVIQPGMTAIGDGRLVEVAIENLFSNARKFTKRVEKPRVEFGTTTTDNGREFFIRDNGAGFDMAFADKLFRPFHRLHADADFAGSGIGLATVQRVVRLHGGTTRATGEVDRGATFYFTLK